MKHIISLGAGVQSSTMALMAAHGEIKPMPECAIFADTGWEPEAVYHYLDYLKSKLPFPVVTVTAGNIRDDQMNKRRIMRKSGRNPKTDRFATLPYFVKNQTTESIGKVKRQCTAEYKIYPIELFIRRQILKIAPRKHAPKIPVVTQWRGISTDEASRMKPSKVKWITVRYPLAMELGMSRSNCLKWIETKGYLRPPRSACIGCPFHSNEEWLDMKTNRPKEFASAVEFDRVIRHASGMRSESFLHRACLPIGEIDFAKLEAERTFAPLMTHWAGECEGMCGL